MKITKAKIQQLIKELGLKDGDEAKLDEIVLDLKAGESSDINNGGIAAQVEYILRSCGLVEAAKNKIREVL